jgi:hypothetical protein
VLLAFGVAPSTALACDPIQSPSGPPVNDCPAHPCSAFKGAGAPPQCNDAGACVADGDTSGLVLVVALPSDSYFAPGRTFTIAFENLSDYAPSPRASECPAPSCVYLPDYGAVQGAYLVSPKVAETVQWNLGNPGYTALPVQATYRPFWPPGGPTTVSTESLGLPVGPVQATTIAAPADLAFPGPANGPSIAFQTYLQPGMYERTLLPTPPFGRFAPEIKVVTVAKDQMPEADKIDAFDITRETGEGPTIPTFDITRADGLDGWTAYLRNSAKTVISNVAALGGTTTKRVLLATNHVPSGMDALTNAELVVAPPPGLPVPTGVFAPIGQVLPASETYPTLPAPVTVSGKIVGEDAMPIAADLDFEALSVADANGRLNSSNFEFVGHASARRATPAAESSYAVDLPPGQYRLSVRPLDVTKQMSIVPFQVDANNGSIDGRDVVVRSRRTVLGTALVADGRPLSGGTVEAVPTGCVALDATSRWCLPRWVSESTADDGSFRLALDPGKYELRVRPADGARLPWVALQTPLSVGPADLPVTLSTVTVPAPVFVGHKLVDPAANPIVNAVVRVFQVHAGGPAVELGRAITSATTGEYNMYIAPPLQ